MMTPITLRIFSSSGKQATDSLSVLPNIAIESSTLSYLPPRGNERWESGGKWKIFLRRLTSLLRLNFSEQNRLSAANMIRSRSLIGSNFRDKIYNDNSEFLGTVWTRLKWHNNGRDNQRVMTHSNITKQI